MNFRTLWSCHSLFRFTSKSAFCSHWSRLGLPRYMVETSCHSPAPATIYRRIKTKVEMPPSPTGMLEMAQKGRESSHTFQSFDFTPPMIACKKKKIIRDAVLSLDVRSLHDTKCPQNLKKYPEVRRRVVRSSWKYFLNLNGRMSLIPDFPIFSELYMWYSQL